ncbi:hypothetical protein PP715_23360 [Ralstonia solanacearum]|uniref:hypothetical protein n=1 Tax=Ralstonia solanacearum TaxID=305 RepID=UPI0006970562|nr:hypothetical protein [Ralstonia solanacearum]AMP72631.1 hypothetical protein UW163_24160 [Ralstonia solanacearum]MCL9842423.1 hypothetical protein [Ralstonia solanacearum]MDB0534519.1 hypothetical protein [Ralstonia solanacearum]MDB0539315.1 hypothetical protein [Ralstonia solanacearum]MDB0549121.1 hypothetical protein [Ralstonia solanacearum]
MEETVMATKKIATPPSPQLVEGVLFEARTAWGTVTVLGIPFEYLDRLWAVHLAIGDTGLWPKWVVSDVATGANVPGVIEGSPDLARTSALKVLAELGTQKLKEAAKKFSACSKSRANRKGGKAGPTPLTPALQQL